MIPWMSESADARLLKAQAGQRRLLLLTYALGGTALLLQATHGIIFLPLTQRYLPEVLSQSVALPGYALAIFGAAKLVTQVPGGWLSDALGRRPAALSGLALSFLSIALMAAIKSIYLFLVASALFGISFAVIWPA